jgi:hypothetical protein
MNCGLRHFGNDVMQLYAPLIWRYFGSVLPFQTRLTQTKPVLPLSNEHGSQVKDQGQRQCCHNKHKKFPCRPTRDVTLFPGHASYLFAYNFDLSCSCRAVKNCPCDRQLLSSDHITLQEIQQDVPNGLHLLWAGYSCVN